MEIDNNYIVNVAYIIFKENPAHQTRQQMDFVQLSSSIVLGDRLIVINILTKIHKISNIKTNGQLKKKINKNLSLYHC